MTRFDVDLREYFTAIRDQGRRQTCMAFAASDAHAMVHGRPMSDLSVEYAHYFASKRMPTYQPASGTSGDAMLETLRIDGQPPESEWRYLPNLLANMNDYRPPANVSVCFRYAGKQLQALDEVENALTLGWPVIMGLALSKSFYELPADTILQADSDTGVTGRHAVLAVGRFSAAAVSGFLVRNSWGTRWAGGGYGLISKSYIEPRMLFLGVYRA
jgi:C1A family cysteine protease